MAAYLLTWKPTRWAWENHPEQVAATQRGERPLARWSSGNRRNIEEGARVFLMRQGTERGIIGSGITVREGYAGEHWDNDSGRQANFVDVEWDTILDATDVLPIEKLEQADLGVRWNNLYASGVQVPDGSVPQLEKLWADHLAAIGRGRLFYVGEQYTRPDICDLLNVPEDRRGGDWNTGSHQHADDWFIFASVGTSGRTGHDYDNFWDGDELIWRGRNGSRLDQPKTKSQLNPPGRVHIFTRDSDRAPFTYEGTARAREAHDDRNGGPVTIRWFFPDRLDQRPEVLPNEVLESETYREGAVRTITVNAYERNPAARRKCIEHHGTICAICGFDFEAIYGVLGKGYIHVHHLRDLASIGGQYEVDPINDLRPVCPNCHAMLHRRVPAMSIESLIAIIEHQSNG